MIKLHTREMKNLSRILTIMLCFAPVAYVSAGPVATTAGNNLTAFNPSNAMNNQWATMSNGRYDGNVSAKADFGNCNALILRCAQPKCSNGGCGDMSVASAIVKGCVQSNSSCKQYGDDLVQYMSAQLVANSNAKINEQNAAAQQAAAAAAAQQSQQQMAAMQQQMQQMQYQMQQQQAESQQQLQAALAQQQAQSQAALESMKTAATEAAKQNEAGVSAYQQDAINRGISTDILERQKIAGQVMTEIENAETSLKEVKVAMNTAFEYAGCDARGNNCTGPKRIKKWRELATEFLTPYDNTIDKIYDGLVIAQTVGIPLSDIYMMLNNSCNSWGQYMCPQMDDGQIVYTDATNGQKGTPYVCSTINNNTYNSCLVADGCSRKETASEQNDCRNKCLADYCRPCNLLKVLTDQNDVYEGWVNADYETKSGNTTVVACASGALDSSALFARRTKNKNGAGLVDIDKLDVWLNQVEPRKTKGIDENKMYDYCDASGAEDKLEKARASKSVMSSGLPPLCVTELGKDTKEKSDDCGYINKVYAICDTHPYNIGEKTGSAVVNKNSNDCSEEERKVFPHAVWAEKDNTGKCSVLRFCENGYEVIGNNCVRYEDKPSDETAYNTQRGAYIAHINEMFGDMKEVIGLKTTVISQQMYKQYEYLNATLRRLKTQLEKATLTATLEAAGAKSDDSSSGLLGGGSSKNSQYRNCSGKDDAATLECFRENYSNLWNQTKEGKKCNNKDAVSQIVKDIKIMNALLDNKVAKDNMCASVNANNCEDCLNEYNAGMNNLKRQIQKDEADRNRRY